MHHQCRARKQLGVRRVLGHADRFRQRLPRPVARVGANQQHRAHAQLHSRPRRVLEEPPRRQHRRRPQRKHHRRLARGQKLLQMRRQRCVALLRVVVAEARNQRVLRPVLLLHAQHPRKQRQHQARRVLGVEERIPAPGQPQLRAQLVDRLRPLPAHQPRQPPDRPPHSRHRFIRPRQPRIHGQNRRIES